MHTRKAWQVISVCSIWTWSKLASWSTVSEIAISNQQGHWMYLALSRVFGWTPLGAGEEALKRTVIWEDSSCFPSQLVLHLSLLFLSSTLSFSFPFFLFFFFFLILSSDLTFAVSWWMSCAVDTNNASLCKFLSMFLCNSHLIHWI